MATGTTAGNGLIGLRAVGAARYDSIMCSIEQRLKEIGQAIEELAVQAGMPADSVTDGGVDVPEQDTAPGGAATPAAGGATGGAADGEASTNTEDLTGTEQDDSGRILARLAELWGLLADLDPEVARRLAGYQALLSPADLRPAA